LFCDNQGVNGVVAGRYCGRKKYHNGLCWFTNERPCTTEPVVKVAVEWDPDIKGFCPTCGQAIRTRKRTKRKRKP